MMEDAGDTTAGDGDGGTLTLVCARASNGVSRRLRIRFYNTLQSWGRPLLGPFCEAQGKGRAKGRPRKVTKRSFMDGGWWLVVYLSLMLYIKFG